MDFRDARIPHANFSGSDLTHANFMGADISHANFNGANLSHANLQGADVSHATFVNTNLAEADFAGATMEGAILFQQDQNQQQLANQGHRLHVNAVRFSPNQQTPLLVSAGNDAQICVWDPVTGQQIRCWQPHHSAILSLDFSVDGHLLVSASADKTARLHTTQNWQTSYVLQHDAAVTMCRFSKPEETTIACVEGGKTVKLWSAADGGFLGGFQHKHIIKDMQFSLDGSMLVFANANGTISLCDANTGKQEGLLGGNQNGINRLAFSPKNFDLFITANSDGTLDLWDTSTKTIQQTFTGHYGCVNDVSFA
ncbi:MAG: pentapeptide repeat-containing protein, partial [Myxococcota bacterium]